MLFSINQLRLLAMMPDDFVQKMRVTGSAAFATKYLPRKNASVLGYLVPDDRQALAIPLVQQITKSEVYSPSYCSR